MRSRKMKIAVVAACLMFLSVGSSKGFSCSTDGCSLSSHAKKYWQAAPEYPSAWKGKMRLLGYLGTR